jgi:hypothetical protein
VEEAYQRHVGLAERRARDLVDREVSAYCPAHALAELFLRLGDPARALAFTEELVAEDPTDEAAHLAAVLALIGTGNDPRAHLALQEAEFWSSQRGRPSAAAARAFLEAGRPVEAVIAARQALALASGGQRRRAFEILVEAALAADRAGEGRAVLQAALAELPAPRHDDLRARLRRRLGRRAPPWLTPLQGLPPAAPSPRLLEAPWAVAAREARALLEPTGSAERVEIEAELLLLGLAGDGTVARGALEAFARLVEVDGLGELARDARLEARKVGPPASAF